MRADEHVVPYGDIPLDLAVDDGSARGEVVRIGEDRCAGANRHASADGHTALHSVDEAPRAQVAPLTHLYPAPVVGQHTVVIQGTALARAEVRRPCYLNADGHVGGRTIQDPPKPRARTRWIHGHPRTQAPSREGGDLSGQSPSFQGRTFFRAERCWGG